MVLITLLLGLCDPTAWIEPHAKLVLGTGDGDSRKPDGRPRQQPSRYG